jgi:hypothetical protein
MTIWLKAHPHCGRIEHLIPERPLLHACCGLDRNFSGRVVHLDKDPGVHPDVLGDIFQLPVRDSSFAATFADVPWIGTWKFNLGRALREFLRVAPVCYILSPWIDGAKAAPIDRNRIPIVLDWPVDLCYQPGIHHPILLVRYLRRELNPHS